MPNTDLPPDPDALKKWRDLPQGVPSKEALPPAAGGIPTLFRTLFPRGLLWLFLVMFVLSLVVFPGCASREPNVRLFGCPNTQINCPFSG